MTPRYTFGRRVVEVGCFLAFADVEGRTLDFLEDINRRWPDLSFKDFWGAYVLAAAVEWEPEGRA
jgi:hypothetical protein